MSTTHKIAFAKSPQYIGHQKPANQIYNNAKREVVEAVRNDPDADFLVLGDSAICAVIWSDRYTGGDVFNAALQEAGLNTTVDWMACGSSLRSIFDEKNIPVDIPSEGGGFGDWVVYSLKKVT